MIKGGALLYAMFLVIVITIISSSFILVNFYTNSNIIKLLKKEQLYLDANSGINYALALHNEIPFNSKVEVDLFSDQHHSVTLEKKNWGAFSVLTSRAIWNKKQIFKSALVGSNISEGEPIALYLADQNKPLSLCGNTKIKGTSYVPRAGIKRAYIEGKSFARKKLIDGIKKYSNKSLPPINKELIELNAIYLESISSLTDSIVSFELVEEKDSIINSFQNTTLLIYSPYSINISNKVIEGNVIIKSDKEIIIQSNAIMSSVILYANSVVIKERFEGDVQIFAKKSLLVEPNCKLKYPSVLALIKKNRENRGMIMIEENTELKGSVFLYNQYFDRKNQPLISIGKNTVIHGQIYSSDLLELKGKVYGGVFCRSLLLKTPSSVYENHLLDVVIDREGLSDFFVGPPLTEETNHQRVIKWLN